MHAGQHHGAAATTDQGETGGSTHTLKPGTSANTKLNEHSTTGAKVEENSHAKTGAKTDAKTGAKTDTKSGTETGTTSPERSKSETSGKASSSTSEKTSGSASTTHEKATGSKHGAATELKSGTTKENTTTGQGALASSAKLTTQQRTKITTIIKQKKVEPAHLNISVHVGVRVPEHVHYYSLPSRVVEIYPEWRGYDYILVSDQILVINPDTHVVVAILET